MSQTEREIVQGIGSDYTRRRLDGAAQESRHEGAGLAGAVWGGASGD